MRMGRAHQRETVVGRTAASGFSMTNVSQPELTRLSTIERPSGDHFANTSGCLSEVRSE